MNPRRYPYSINWLSDESGDVSERDRQEVLDLEHVTGLDYLYTAWGEDGVGRPKYRHIMGTGWEMRPAP